MDPHFLDSSDEDGNGDVPRVPETPSAARTAARGPGGRGGRGVDTGTGADSPAIPPTPRVDRDDDDDDDEVVPPTPAPPRGRGGDDDDDRTPGGSTPLTPLSPLDAVDRGGSTAANAGEADGAGDTNNGEGADASGVGGIGGEQAHIRGTDVHVPSVEAAFLDFLRNFRSLSHARKQANQRQRQAARRLRQRQRQQQQHEGDSESASEDSDSDMDDEDDDASELLPPPLYMSRLQSLLTRGAMAADVEGGGQTAGEEGGAPTVSPRGACMELDAMHLYFHSPACQRLYHQLIAYPIEIITLLDLIAKNEIDRIAVEVLRMNLDGDAAAGLIPPSIQVRPYNLKTVSSLRCLDPVSMDCLVAIKGMVVRTSPIIPDLKIAHFTCSICGHAEASVIDKGRIVEPHRCPECNTQGSYALVHNRCVFDDKQMVRIQERPDQVPAGQTPASAVCFAFDSLVDAVAPGDRVEVTGVLKAQPARVNAKLSKIKSVYKTYIDVVHYRKITGMAGGNKMNGGENPTAGEEADMNNNNSNLPTTDPDQPNHKGKWSAERVAQLKALSQDPDIYDKLVQSLAPSIWELDNIKKGILCMLFGGNHVRVKKKKKKQMQSQQRSSNESSGKDGDDDGDSWLDDDDDDDADGDNRVRGRFGVGSSTTKALHKRGDINILLCGDPGTSKSQLLSYVNKLSTRGVYTSGKGSSAVGLTASVVRDPETRDLVLESGALVLSDLGICCIDEFDKMSDTTRSVLHEAMEQQTVSIAKAGIIATLHARTSVLASANPTESRYNPNLSVIENIQLPPTLLSRFDLIYLILDNPNVEQDRKLAQHLVGLYYETPNVVEPPISQDLLRDYIEYARDNIHPEISNEACEQLIASYLELRGGGGNGTTALSGGGGTGFHASNGARTISATPRQLESLIRVSEALAKMRYSGVVTRNDAREAVRLMRVATQAAATDPRTGRIDMDMITTGRSSADRETEERMELALKELLAERRGSRMSIRDVTRQLIEITNAGDASGVGGADSSGALSHTEVLEALRRMEADGIIQLNERAQTIFVRAGIVR